MTRDYKPLAKAETDRISELAHSLTAEQWNHDSLCAGWKVRDVMGHMTFGFSTPLPKVLTTVARYRGNVPRASDIESRRLAASMTQSELVALYDAGRASPKGLGRLIKSRDLFADNLVHELDIRRPLGLSRQLGPEESVALLDALCSVKSALFKPREKAQGLSLISTDAPWSRVVEGAPRVEGTTEDLALALSGRPAGLDGLTGEGTSELRQRLTAAA